MRIMVNENSSHEPVSNAGGSVPPMGRPYKIDTEPPPQESKPKPDPGLRSAPALSFLIAANVAVFLCMVVASSGQAFMQPTAHMLLEWGADYGPSTLGSGEFWRLFTSNFVHIGAAHITLNMLLLNNCGRPVEFLYGSSKFLFIYLCAGLGGAIAEMFFSPNIPSAGASGAIFGILGAFLTVLRHHAKRFDTKWLQATLRYLVFLVILNLLYGFSHKGIGNAAHIGGFISGVVAGAFVMPKDLDDKTWSKQDIMWAAFLLLMLGGLGYADYLSFIPTTH